MTGQAMGGLFASVANIITLAAGTNVIDSGLGFFIAATLTSVLGLLGYGLLYYLVSTCIHYENMPVYYTEIFKVLKNEFFQQKVCAIFLFLAHLSRRLTR